MAAQQDMVAALRGGPVAVIAAAGTDSEHQIEIAADDLVGNVRRVAAFEVDRALGKLGGPVDGVPLSGVGRGDRSADDDDEVRCPRRVVGPVHEVRLGEPRPRLVAGRVRHGPTPPLVRGREHGGERLVDLLGAVGHRGLDPEVVQRGLADLGAFARRRVVVTRPVGRDLDARADARAGLLERGAHRVDVVVDGLGQGDHGDAAVGQLAGDDRLQGLLVVGVAALDLAPLVGVLGPQLLLVLTQLGDLAGQGAADVVVEGPGTEDDPDRQRDGVPERLDGGGHHPVRGGPTSGGRGLSAGGWPGAAGSAMHVMLLRLAGLRWPVYC